MIPLALAAATILHADALAGFTFVEPWYFTFVAAASVALYARMGVYRSVIRFMGARVVIAIVQSVSVVTIGLVLLRWLLPSSALPVTVLVLFWVGTIFATVGIRFVSRTYLQSQHRPGERVAIYGAGGAGARLASALIGGQEFLPVAFIDDSTALHGSVINGVEVFPPDELPSMISELGITRVLLALPSISRRRRKKIIQKLEATHVHIQTMPNFSDLISGNARVDEIREVDVADLLGRDTVPPNEELLQTCTRGKVIMVTGAGGSIGSELCRQMVRQGPATLLLYEVSEVSLYSVEKELRELIDRESLGNIEIVPLLGSVCDKERAGKAMRSYGVHTVYHAAAYKHVPMVERNMMEGIRNNVFGTLNAALAAEESGVKSFVLVSTDKAVCPTNVMGATKRFAEMVLQGLQDRGAATCFCMVRFGNVLESSGSVVPLFREQIRCGGPVTVTHPEIIRYFMTIPEAAQLVIQAGAMSGGGDVFVLDMGDPVKIEDLARRMIRLMGLTVLSEENPDGDIEIKYTGLRPAEKLYEELLIGKNVMGTHHPMIMRAQEKRLPWSELRVLLRALEEALTGFQCARAREILMKTVEEYMPAAELIDLVWARQQSVNSPEKVARITTLSTQRKG